MHKSLLINADQNRYIEKSIVTLFSVLTSAAQIVILFVFHSFLWYLIIQVVATFLQNVSIAMIANKKYPYLKEKTVAKLEKDEMRDILKKSTALIFYKVGAIVVTSTDTLIISRYLGLETAGLFSNYTLITTSVSILIYQFVGGSIASVGNLWLTETKENTYAMFKNLQLLQFWLSAFATVAIFVLSEPFIKLWIGDTGLMGNSFVLVMSLNFYFSTMRAIVGIFKDAKGLFWNDRYKPIFESLINLGVSILLVRYLGIVGVIVGTIASTVLVTLWVEPVVLFKHGFERKVGPYFADYIVKFLLCVAIAAVTYFACYKIPMNVGGFFARIAIVIVLPNVCLFLLFFKTKEFVYFRSLIKNVCKKVLSLINRKKETKDMEAEKPDTE